jgi:DNA polymerase V
MRVSGNSMIGAGIQHGDIAIVDRSIKATNGKIIIAVVNGDMLIRRLEITQNKIRLVPESKLSAIEVSDFSELKIWGVVTYIIHTPSAP